MFKINEIVLVSNGDGSYSPRKVVGIEGKDTVFISHGHYATDNKAAHIHKCPRSIIKEISHD